MIQAISFRGDRSPVPPRVKIGFESDNLVESLAFELPEISGNQSAMLMISGNAYANMIDLQHTADGEWTVDLAEEMVGPAGVYESYVSILCQDGRKWNSGIFNLITGDLPDVAKDIEALYPTAVDQMRQEMAETRQEMAASVTASEDAAQRAEDAAQRAEDAANQGGGGEAPAKDAVLYTAQTLTEEQKAQARENIGAQSAGKYITAETDPTVPEWAKQPNKPTYTAKEVGALPEDTAIPEPYVLPVATADALGGVKIGEGLEMTGDALGLKPEQPMRLINEIVTTEEAAVINCFVDSAGRPYAVKNAYVVFTPGKIEAEVENFAMVATAGSNPQTLPAVVYTSTLITKAKNNTGASLQYRVNIKNGRMFVEGQDVVDEATALCWQDARIYGRANGTEEHDYIRAVGVKALEGGVWPIGSTLQIYEMGVF